MDYRGFAPKDIRIDARRTDHPPETWVKVTHMPTGIVVEEIEATVGANHMEMATRALERLQVWAGPI